MVHCRYYRSCCWCMQLPSGCRTLPRRVAIRQLDRSAADYRRRRPGIGGRHGGSAHAEDIVGTAFGLVFHPALLILVMGGSGALSIAPGKDRALYGRIALSGEPVLVMGSGSAAENLVRELDKSADWRVVGLISVTSNQVGAEVRGVKILGRCGCGGLGAKLEVRQVIVAMPEASATDRRKAMEVAVQSGFVRTDGAEPVDDMLAGNVSISQVRQVQLEDLLGRNQSSWTTADCTIG